MLARSLYFWPSPLTYWRRVLGPGIWILYAFQVLTILRGKRKESGAITDLGVPTCLEYNAQGGDTMPWFHPAPEPTSALSGQRHGLQVLFLCPPHIKTKTLICRKPIYKATPSKIYSPNDYLCLNLTSAIKGLVLKPICLMAFPI